MVLDEVDVEYASTLWNVERRTRRQLLLTSLNDLAALELVRDADP